MATAPPPRMRVSRNGAMFESQVDNFPSGLLHDSQQLQGMSAPFSEQPSDEYSAWSLHRRRSESEHEDDETPHRSSNSATPGPSRSNTAATPTGRLRQVMDRLNATPSTSASLDVSTTPRPPPPPPPRLEPESDFSIESDGMKSAANSVRGIFKKARELSTTKDEGNATVSTPKQEHQSGSRIPVSGGRKQGRLSVERPSGDDEGAPRPNAGSPSTRAHSESLDLIRAQIDKAELVDLAPSEPDHSRPSSPRPIRIENLNESVVDLHSPSDTSLQSSHEDAGRPESPVPAVRQRPHSAAAAVARPRSILLNGTRNRPLSAYDREYGEISFPSGEVESSTPIKTKAERQRELELGWGHPSRSRVTSFGSSSLRFGSASPVPSISEDRPESPSLADWEKGRERNWNSPRPKELGSRPSSPENLRHSGEWSAHHPYEQDTAASRSRSSSVSSNGSPSGAPRPASRTLERPPSRSSPSPALLARARTVSSTTAAEVQKERERSWNRQQRSTTPNTSHTRTSPMPGIEATMEKLRKSGTSPLPPLSRSRSLGQGSSGSPGPSRPQSASVHHHAPTTTPSLIRRSSWINPVKEENEHEGSNATPQGDRDLSDSQTSSVDDRQNELSMSQAERDASRLQRVTGGLAPPESTTPITSPSRPTNGDATSTTPQVAPPRSTSPYRPPISQPVGNITPSRRGLYQPPPPSSPLPPKGGLPDLPSASDDEASDSQLTTVKEPDDAPVAPPSRFGAGRSFLVKTPKFPGAWNSVNSVAQPPFDDREHPKGKVDPLAFKPEDMLASETESYESTPVVRPQELGRDTSSSETVPTIVTPDDDSLNRPETPDEFGQALQSMDIKTPAPPGHWARETPSQRKSILKVRFDSPTLASQNKQLAPASPSHAHSQPLSVAQVEETAFDILRNLAGEKDGSTVIETPRKRAKANMVDAFGREVRYASDGTPIQLLGDRERTMSMDSVRSVGSIHTVTSDMSGLDVTSTPRRSSATRMVDGYGREINEQAAAQQQHLLDQTNSFGLVDLNSPLEQNFDMAIPQNNHYLRSSGNKELRRDIDVLKIKTAQGIAIPVIDTEPTLLQHLEKEDKLKQLDGAALREAERRKGLEAAYESARTKRASQPKSKRSASTLDRRIRNFPWSLALSFFIVQVIFLWTMLRVAERKGEHLFLTTYYDPTFAGYHDYGHAYQPSLFSWLIRGDESSSLSIIQSWISDVMYYSFGSETTHRPSFIPS